MHHKTKSKKTIESFASDWEQSKICSKNKKYKIHLYISPSSFDHAKFIYQESDVINLSAASADDEIYHETLQSMNVLFVPSPFNIDGYKYTQFSVPAKLPSYLAFFSGKRFIPIVSGISAILVTYIFTNYTDNILFIKILLLSLSCCIVGMIDDTRQAFENSADDLMYGVALHDVMEGACDDYE